MGSEFSSSLRMVRKLKLPDVGHNTYVRLKHDRTNN